MSYLINNQQNFNEVVFENRNKNYGAYAIRSSYGITLLKSLLFMVLGFGTFVALAFYYSNKNYTPNKNINPFLLNDSLTVTIFDLKPEEPIKKESFPQKQEQPQSKTTTSENTNVRVSDSVSVETHSLLNTHQPGAMTTNTSTLGEKNDPGPACAGFKPGSAIEIEPTNLIYVDSQPEFEGGLKALYKFVSQHLKYPEDASDRGKQGTVYVKFVVDEQGKVGQLSLLNTVGYGLDEEALRVVGIIPNFKSPAKVNDKAVKVYYQLPIKFSLGK